MNDPFDLTDATIRDLPHVLVTRHVLREGQLCIYRKVMKPAGLGQPHYWMQRENEFLLDSTLKRLRHTVELAAFAQEGAALHTPIIEFVATRDAGVTLDDWMRIKPRYHDGRLWDHPFQYVGEFFRLTRACLVALKEIHEHGIVHCDIKGDNICLPYHPYPARTDIWIQPDYERIKLIDFAFSITPERPLEHPLPILPTAPYQSNLLRTALRSDQSGRNRGTLAVQQVDYRADLFSLGYLLELIYDAGLRAPKGINQGKNIRNFINRLKGFEIKRRNKRLPHDELITDINEWLAAVETTGTHLNFKKIQIAVIREKPFLGSVNKSRSGQSTPVTPIAVKYGKSYSSIFHCLKEVIKLIQVPPRITLFSIFLLPFFAWGSGYIAYIEGSMYANGWIVSKSDDQAAVLYRKAAEKGLTGAQYSIGVMYSEGRGVTRDYLQALKWLGKAAGKGHASAQYKIGFMYANGLGTAKEKQQALWWYRKAADQGNAEAQAAVKRLEKR